MFNHIGKKIKMLAIIQTWLGIAASLIAAVILAGFVEENNIAVGIIIFIVGSVVAWMSSFLLYGFGQLVDNSDIIAENTYISASHLSISHQNSNESGTNR